MLDTQFTISAVLVRRTYSKSVGLNNIKIIVQMFNESTVRHSFWGDTCVVNGYSTVSQLN